MEHPPPSSRLIHLLRRVPLFSGLEAEDLESLLAIARERRHARRARVFAEGEEAQGFYVVVSGRVKLYKLSPEGKEQILHLTGPGQAFAEAALFAGGGYPATAECLSAARLLFFPRGAFLALLGTRPQLALNIIAGLSWRLREFVRLIEELALQSASARVAKYLLDEALRTGAGHEPGAVVELAVSKGQLAARLGTAGETLSRTLAKLRDRGALRVEGRRITLLDPDALERTAAGLEG